MDKYKNEGYITNTSHQTSQKASLIFLMIIIFLVAGAVIGAYFWGVNVHPSPLVSGVTTDITNSSSTSSAFNQNSIQSPTASPSFAVKNITIPKDWKVNDIQDLDLGVKLQMSLPSDFTFRINDSSYVIESTANPHENWEVRTSIYRDDSDVLKNHYDNTSRGYWYKNYWAKRSGDKVLNMVEKPVGSQTYLDVTVQTIVFNDDGDPIGNKLVKHYVIVKDGILIMIFPTTNKAGSTSAKVPKLIEPILYSITASEI